MDEHQLVPAKVQETQVEEGREAVGSHGCNSVDVTDAVTSALRYSTLHHALKVNT